MRVLYLLLSSIVGLQAASLYQVSSLANFGGPLNAAFAVNSKGQAAGGAVTANGTSVAFSSSGTAKVLGTQGSATDINGSGVVVGTSYVAGETRATVWKDGVATQLLSYESSALGINEAGDIVGAASTSTRTSAFLNRNGQTTLINTPGNWTVGYDVNINDQIAGTYQDSSGNFQAFSWTSAGGVQTLGTLGGKSSYGQALNDAGQIVGASAVQSGYLHAFLYAGSMRDLGTLGGSMSAAYDINAAGQVVGYSLDNVGTSRAFLWSNGTMTDLNSLVDPSSGWSLQTAFGINGQGQIVGAGTYQGQTAAFLLDPGASSSALRSSASAVPEPATYAYMATGLILLLVGVRRSRQR